MKIKKIFPKNKEHFKELVPFAQKIIKICRDNKIPLVVYGSFAHFYYTKDKNMRVKDIDILIPRKGLKKLVKLLKRNKINFARCSLEDYSIIIKKGKLRVELDDVGTRYKTINEKSLSKNIFKKVDFYGTPIRMITLKQLEEIYLIAYTRWKRDKARILKKIRHLEKFLRRKLI